MYLRTPKRYQPGHRRRHMFSLRWLWLWVLTGIIVVVGWQVFERRDQLGPPIREFVSNVVDNARGGIATMVAPTPLPTNDPGERIVRGDSAWDQGSIEQAVDEYRVAVADAPNDVRVHYRYAYGLLIEGDYTNALTAAENTVTANPFSADAWAIRALALSRNKRYPEAIASALQALSLDSKSATALAFMSQTYLDAGQPSLAEEKANQALEADPDSAEAHYAHGRWNAESAFLDDAAIADFQAAHDLAPYLPQVMVDMAWSNWRSQNYDVGADELAQVIENNPNNLDALFALGFFQYQVYGDPNKAEDYLSRCVEAAPRNIPCLNYLATVEIGLGNQQAAADSYQKIIDVGTDNPVDYLHAGRTYANLGDCNKATPLLRTGYSMEQQQTVPDVERLAAFEEFMSQCGAPFNPQFSQNVTPDAPLLVPLDGSSSQ